ncbi:MAG TPA: D-aminoacyl-tRNA deacylase [Spirochaetota bacterium]|nr:D-aminoacyl-tRNA deacylase [Spirochaetota bacterium]HNT09258.1 D-aminoacyl-tRNA deacylase [Spirochaetota bacterium]HOS40130.1 D-aminoacyl-tRNA deacylase [Spirochaetota bacterium]
MRAVLQRVLSASVTINGEVVSAIGPGMLALVGFRRGDTDDDMAYLIDKTLGVRIFDDERGVMNRSLAEIDGELLVVSQFTLYGDARKGRRPSYSEAMPPDEARVLYDAFLRRCRERHPRVCGGVFGADMKVALVNDGPVTILLDSSRNL